MPPNRFTAKRRIGSNEAWPQYDPISCSSRAINSIRIVSVKAFLTPDGSRNRRNEEENDRDPKQDSRTLHCRPSDSSEPKHGGNQCNSQKYNGVVNKVTHGRYPVLMRQCEIHGLFSSARTMIDGVLRLNRHLRFILCRKPEIIKCSFRRIPSQHLMDRRSLDGAAFA